MIYSVTGTVTARHNNFFVLETGGIGYKIFTNERTMGELTSENGSVRVFTHLQPREDAMELYGFLHEEELKFFEMLISVSGVGPRSALSILGVAELKQLSAAIKEGRPDVLTHASGIGRKTAERIIVELRTKVQSDESEATVKTMETDADLVETLVALGYRRDQARAALGKVDEKITGMEVRLKAALKILSNK